MDKRIISIVIPARNEESCIVETVKNVEKNVRIPHEVVIVNDNSTDGTEEKAKNLCKKYSNVKLITRKSNHGFGNTLVEGFEKSGGFAVVPVMADMCDDPGTINLMYEKINDYDIIVGSRYIKGGKLIGSPFIKKWISRNYGRIMHWLTGIPTRDITNAFKLYKKEVIEKVKTEQKDFSISVDITLKAYFLGCRITEVPTTWTGRKGGKSKFRVFKMGKSYGSLFLYAVKRKITG